jgi:hypothetical protein
MQKYNKKYNRGWKLYKWLSITGKNWVRKFLGHNWDLNRRENWENSLIWFG